MKNFKKFLAVAFLSFIIFTTTASIIQADEVGLCQPCDGTIGNTCQSPLVCVDGKCRPGPGGCPEGQICNPLTACTIQELIDKIITYVFYLALAVVPVLVITGGALIMTAGGSPERVKKGKTIILYTVIGLIIVLLSKGLISLVKFVFGY